MAFMPDPHTGYRLQPGGRGSFVDGIPGVANSDGHRDDELPARRADSLRILALGDSFTVGTNVRMEDTWPANLERRLRSEQPEPVDVINAGVGGWAPYQYAQYYQHHGRAFERTSSSWASSSATTPTTSGTGPSSCAPPSWAVACGVRPQRAPSWCPGSG
jgi:hypothetical protein